MLPLVEVSRMALSGGRRGNQWTTSKEQPPEQ